MLTPLLRHTNGSAGESKETPLISIKAEALMEDNGLVIGSEVPLSLSVYIEDPVQFFAVFSSGIAGGGSSSDDASSSFFYKKISKKKKLLPPVAVAGFRLLQWAQYGNVPTFVAPAAAAKAASSVDGDGAEDITDDSSSKSEDE